MPTFGSLFAGIGGIDLGLERAGWTGRWQVEYEPFCQRVLAKHWPDVPRYGDIYDVDWSGVERVDLIAGGFPCQPFSVAGRRRGIDDDRWLWPEFARAVCALRPRFVLVENVPGLLAGGGMGGVLGGLAELGYDAEWDSIPAAAVGAPHLRYRVWIVGYRPELRRTMADADIWGSFHALRAGRDASRNGREDVVAHTQGQPIGAGLREDGSARLRWRRPSDGGRTMADTNGSGPQGHGRFHREWNGASQRPLGSSGGSLGEWWSVEPDVGRVAHGVPARVDRLRSLGNAVVPQVVEFIGRRILEAEALT